MPLRTARGLEEVGVAMRQGGSRGDERRADRAALRTKKRNGLHALRHAEPNGPPLAPSIERFPPSIPSEPRVAISPSSRASQRSRATTATDRRKRGRPSSSTTTSGLQRGSSGVERHLHVSKERENDPMSPTIVRTPSGERVRLLPTFQPVRSTSSASLRPPTSPSPPLPPSDVSATGLPGFPYAHPIPGACGYGGYGYQPYSDPLYAAYAQAQAAAMWSMWTTHDRHHQHHQHSVRSRRRSHRQRKDSIGTASPSNNSTKAGTSTLNAGTPQSTTATASGSATVKEAVQASPPNHPPTLSCEIILDPPDQSPTDNSPCRSSRMSGGGVSGVESAAEGGMLVRDDDDGAGVGRVGDSGEKRALEDQLVKAHRQIEQLQMALQAKQDPPWPSGRPPSMPSFPYPYPMAVPFPPPAWPPILPPRFIPPPGTLSPINEEHHHHHHHHRTRDRDAGSSSTPPTSPNDAPLSLRQELSSSPSVSEEEEEGGVSEMDRQLTDAAARLAADQRSAFQKVEWSPPVEEPIYFMAKMDMMSQGSPTTASHGHEADDDDGPSPYSPPWQQPSFFAAPALPFMPLSRAPSAGHGQTPLSRVGSPPSQVTVRRAGARHNEDDPSGLSSASASSPLFRTRTLPCRQPPAPSAPSATDKRRRRSAGNGNGSGSGRSRAATPSHFDPKQSPYYPSDKDPWPSGLPRRKQSGLREPQNTQVRSGRKSSLPRAASSPGRRPSHQPTSLPPRSQSARSGKATSCRRQKRPPWLERFRDILREGRPLEEWLTAELGIEETILPPDHQRHQGHRSRPHSSSVHRPPSAIAEEEEQSPFMAREDEGGEDDSPVESHAPPQPPGDDPVDLSPASGVSGTDLGRRSRAAATRLPFVESPVMVNGSISSARQGHSHGAGVTSGSSSHHGKGVFGLSDIDVHEGVEIPHHFLQFHARMGSSQQSEAQHQQQQEDGDSPCMGVGETDEVSEDDGHVTPITPSGRSEGVLASGIVALETRIANPEALRQKDPQPGAIIGPPPPDTRTNRNAKQHSTTRRNAPRDAPDESSPCASQSSGHVSVASFSSMRERQRLRPYWAMMKRHWDWQQQQRKQRRTQQGDSTLQLQKGEKSPFSAYYATHRYDPPPRSPVGRDNTGGGNGAGGGESDAGVSSG